MAAPEGTSADGDVPDGAELLRRALYSRWQEVPASQLSARQVEMRRLADTMRSIMGRLVRTAATAGQIAEAADQLARLADGFGGLPPGTVYEGFAETANAGDDPTASFEFSPFIGRANPLAPPIQLEEVDGTVRGRAVFSAAYEGAPGCLHGGYIAGAFDEVLGATQSLAGAPGMTGTLTVRYRSPTPLHTELQFVGELLGVEGRKIFTAATLHAGDRLCAEAEGIFISVPPALFADLLARRAADEAERLT